MKNSKQKIFFASLIFLHLCVARMVVVEKCLCYSEPSNYYRTVFWLSFVSKDTEVTCSFGCLSKNCIFAFVDIGKYDLFASCLHNETIEYAEFNDMLEVQFVAQQRGYLFLIHDYERQGASFECDFRESHGGITHGWYKIGLPVCLGVSLIVAIVALLLHYRKRGNYEGIINSEIRQWC